MAGGSTKRSGWGVAAMVVRRRQKLVLSRCKRSVVPVRVAMPASLLGVSCFYGLWANI